ncbi:MAG: 23S rRNA (adenine(2030)-N(6))-methyltransferase RlmJ [Opitutus sp.]
MNYRHHFHAGNFADVMKHALLVQIVRALQRKEKGVLLVDTHAGRGRYDLSSAASGDSKSRQPEWPDGIGRLWGKSQLSPDLEAYLSLVRQFDHDRGNRDALPRFYPGSPWLLRLLARDQDRVALCEMHPEEFHVLSQEFQFAPRTTIQEMDGYVGVRALLPPVERRALVLIDPPFERQDEFAQVVQALKDGLARLSSGVFAVWYPLTERARVDDFLNELSGLQPPPTLTIELAIAGEHSPIKLRGCGVAVINPPWQLESTARRLGEELAGLLKQDPGAGAQVRWLVPER